MCISSSDSSVTYRVLVTQNTTALLMFLRWFQHPSFLWSHLSISRPVKPQVFTLWGRNCVAEALAGNRPRAAPAPRCSAAPFVPRGFKQPGDSLPKAKGSSFIIQQYQTERSNVKLRRKRKNCVCLYHGLSSWDRRVLQLVGTTCLVVSCAQPCLFFIKTMGSISQIAPLSHHKPLFFSIQAFFWSCVKFHLEGVIHCYPYLRHLISLHCCNFKQQYKIEQAKKKKRAICEMQKRLYRWYFLISS